MASYNKSLLIILYFIIIVIELSNTHKVSSILKERYERDSIVNAWVFFKDKPSYEAAKRSENRVEALIEYASKLESRTLDRRHKMKRTTRNGQSGSALESIIDDTDFPIHEDYIQRVLQKGSKTVLRSRSKWLNGISLRTTLENLYTISNLPFVRQIEPVITYKKEPFISATV